jgi:hypothetical protein
MTDLALQIHRTIVPSVRFRGTIENATWPLRKAVWKLEESFIWPVADAVRGRRPRHDYAARRRLIRRPHRPGWFSRLDVRLALATVAIAASVGVGVAAIAGGLGGKHGTASAPTASVATPPKAPASGGTRASQTPTLEGVTPQFQTSPGSASKTDAATAASVSPLQGTNAKPSRIPPGATTDVAALHTARDFAGAFVLYEVGQSDAKVRKTFVRTGTPALAKSLRDRPPRLPGSGEVPKAQVRNVVLGVRHGRHVAASVSLLRLGDLSELRLTLTKLPRGWAVSEVRG